MRSLVNVRVRVERLARDVGLGDSRRVRDLSALSAADVAELEALDQRVTWSDGRPCFDGLSDADLERLETLVNRTGPATTA